MSLYVIVYTNPLIPIDIKFVDCNGIFHDDVSKATIYDDPKEALIELMNIWTKVNQQYHHNLHQFDVDLRFWDNWLNQLLNAEIRELVVSESIIINRESVRAHITCEELAKEDNSNEIKWTDPF